MGLARSIATSAERFPAFHSKVQNFDPGFFVESRGK
jgi:hypothetical protein